jgi:lipoprotein-anchoring transpeptidase ErfK/SrfK
MTHNIRLALFSLILLCAAALLGFAHEIIAAAAESGPSSALFDPSALLAFDPTAALTAVNSFWADGADLSSVESNSPDGTTDPSGGAADSMGISARGSAATTGLTNTLEQIAPSAFISHTYPDPGWPRTTAETVRAAPSANPPTTGQWIDINLTKQTVTAYSGTVPLKTVLTSTGTRLHPTVVGTFHVWAKVPSQTMRGGSWRQHDRYSLPGVPNILFFYQGYSLHGTYWHRNFGHPMSHGCANLTMDDAAWFYNWAPLGITVRTHYG